MQEFVQLQMPLWARSFDVAPRRHRPLARDFNSCGACAVCARLQGPAIRRHVYVTVVTYCALGLAGVLSSRKKSKRIRERAKG